MSRKCAAILSKKRPINRTDSLHPIPRTFATTMVYPYEKGKHQNGGKVPSSQIVPRYDSPDLTPRPNGYTSRWVIGEVNQSISGTRRELGLAAEIPIQPQSYPARTLPRPRQPNYGVHRHPSHLGATSPQPILGSTIPRLCRGLYTFSRGTITSRLCGSEAARLVDRRYLDSSPTCSPSTKCSPGAWANQRIV